MIDPTLLRSNPDVVRASLIARGDDPAIVDRVLEADQVRRDAISTFETLRA
ncbi:MAG: Serine--tRNA ligase, partial [Actinomycetota bacterium]